MLPTLITSNSSCSSSGKLCTVAGSSALPYISTGRTSNNRSLPYGRRGKNSTRGKPSNVVNDKELPYINAPHNSISTAKAPPYGMSGNRHSSRGKTSTVVNCSALPYVNLPPPSISTGSTPLGSAGLGSPTIVEATHLQCLTVEHYPVTFVKRTSHHRKHPNQLPNTSISDGYITNSVRTRCTYSKGSLACTEYDCSALTLHSERETLVSIRCQPYTEVAEVDPVQFSEYTTHS